MLACTVTAVQGWKRAERYRNSTRRPQHEHRNEAQSSPLLAEGVDIAGHGRQQRQGGTGGTRRGSHHSDTWQRIDYCSSTVLAGADPAHVRSLSSRNIERKNSNPTAGCAY